MEGFILCCCPDRAGRILLERSISVLRWLLGLVFTERVERTVAAHELLEEHDDAPDG